VTRRASSTTDSGTARLGFASVVPLVLEASPLVADLALAPLELEDMGFRAESWRTSSRTRLRRAGKVATSPERRRDRACD
jgi:hypothetical protein